MELSEQLLDSWRIHARIQRYVLDAVSPEALVLDGGVKGRAISEQFAHIHNVRLMWLKSAAPELLTGLEKIEKAGSASQTGLQQALDASAVAVEALLRGAFESGRVKGFKPHPAAFLGYLIAHESYHQGDIGVRLTESGHRLDQKVAYGMWEWGSR